MGMIEASGIGWQGRYEQAELLAASSTRWRPIPPAPPAFRDRVTGTAWPDVTGGYHYLGLDRMAYYVNKDAYRGAVRREKSALEASA